MSDGSPLTAEVTAPTEPTAPDHSNGTSVVSARPGELVSTWRLAVVFAWALVVFAYSAVWKVSVELGIGTWWLGARSSPQPLVVRVLPFVLAIALGLVSSYRIRRVPLFNVVGAVLMAAIAVPDFSRSVGLAVIELVVAAAMMLVAIASFSGVAKTGDR
jgi:hypothetical protein